MTACHLYTDFKPKQIQVHASITFFCVKKKKTSAKETDAGTTAIPNTL